MDLDSSLNIYALHRYLLYNNEVQHIYKSYSLGTGHKSEYTGLLLSQKIHSNAERQAI